MTATAHDNPVKRRAAITKALRALQAATVMAVLLLLVLGQQQGAMLYALVAPAPALAENGAGGPLLPAPGNITQGPATVTQHFTCRYQATTWDVAITHVPGSADDALGILAAEYASAATPSAQESAALAKIQAAFPLGAMGVGVEPSLDSAGTRLPEARMRVFGAGSTSPGKPLAVGVAFPAEKHTVLFTMRLAPPGDITGLFQGPTPEELQAQLEEVLPLPPTASVITHLQNDFGGFVEDVYLTRTACTPQRAGQHFQDAIAMLDVREGAGDAWDAWQRQQLPGRRIDLFHMQDEKSAQHALSLIKIRRARGAMAS